MSIKGKGQVGGAVILGAMAVSVIFTSVQIDKIRFGGDMDRRNQQVSDLTADILPPPEYVIEPYLEATLLVANPSTLPDRQKRLAELEQQFNDRYAYWKSSDLPPALKEQILNRSGAKAIEFWTELNQRLLPAVAGGNMDRAQASYARLTDDYVSHRAEIDKLVVAAGEAQTRLSEDSHATLASTILWLSVLGVLIVAMLVGGIFYLIRNALNPLSATADAMRRMAEGDFDVAVEGNGRKDEIGTMVQAIEVFRAASKAQAEAESKQRQVVEDLAAGLRQVADGNMTHRIDHPFANEYETLRTSFNETVEGLATILARVSGSASSVHTGASEIRAASDDLALRTEQQAASLEETAAAMNQVTRMVQETARSAAEVNGSIAQAHREATEGGQVVRRAVSAMGAIEKSSQEISQIINVIDGIAFQTNLLALNAGVEAARAGDAGKGFAVVANEVRALAQRSADAAKDIKGLIMTSSEQVSDGVTLVGETGSLLERIVERVGAISALITAIAESAEVQSANLQQVNGAVGEMDKMTQQNAAMVEESTAAARSLAGEADELSSLVARFRTGSVEEMPVAMPAPVRRSRTPRRAPVVQGNLAMKPVDDEDWSEF
ncbi:MULTISPECIES: methyl-accepting chemotaxis protein [unclassified Sphingomonas]|jgi:methyl-accepting chemotaxis protein|uniref:methyl-accepting chemotaxis protein n=1 Tax=unclassified Sphingomonas TaxID=196159 RepID=UPI00083272C3|nr:MULTISPECIES: methyl-accepting chemotaxis protein [unclassified Sphingomonas]